MLVEKRIKLNPDKCQAILEMQNPNVVKDIQKLNERLETLIRFMAKLVNRAMPFFKILKKLQEVA